MVFVVVDNNKSDLKLLSQRLTTAIPECQVQLFTDPLLSAKYICNNPVDAVFLADTMQPVNGFQLMQVLRKNIPKLAIVMLSDSDLNRVYAFQAGSTDYFQKPISAEQLEGVTKQIARAMRHDNKLESGEYNQRNESNLNPETNALADDELNYISGGSVVSPIVYCPKCGSANTALIIRPGYSGYSCRNCGRTWE